jgi:hypothetical protein
LWSVDKVNTSTSCASRPFVRLQCWLRFDIMLVRLHIECGEGVGVTLRFPHPKAAATPHRCQRASLTTAATPENMMSGKTAFQESGYHVLMTETNLRLRNLEVRIEGSKSRLPPLEKRYQGYLAYSSMPTDRPSSNTTATLKGGTVAPKPHDAKRNDIPLKTKRITDSPPNPTDHHHMPGTTQPPAAHS